ncbi:MAG: HD domain-containing protein [Bacteroidales bacterium]|nr:HD domain-containing protein [Bacteroidales bacterium]MCF8396523.1 HD domain-containing protein [Bacteroidales bacterium]
MEQWKNQTIIDKTAAFVKESLSGAEGGHDWWHVQRVRKMSIYIARHEKADLFVVELGALLHDIADAKFHYGNEEIGPEKARGFLQSLYLKKDILDHIENIIRNISFKGGNHSQQFRSKELDIIQDADRLDAMGAIGIARAFNYGGFKNREIYNPAIKPDLNMSREEYKKCKAPTINHFYEKLLLLKDRMNTPTGQRLAEERHDFMEKFLDTFYEEWKFGEV